MRTNMGPTIGPAQEVKSFLNILNLLQEHNIKAYFIFSPVHAYYYATLEKHGFWDEYLDWLQVISKAVLENKGDFTLWDPSGFNEASSEKVPEPADKTPMKWYWEASHFRWEAGQEILNAILSKKQSQIPISKIESLDSLAKQLSEHQQKKDKFFNDELRAQFKLLSPE